MAEIELSILSRQCLAKRIAKRIADKKTLANEVSAWADTRNKEQVKINWQFKTADARVKLLHLYPTRDSS